MVTNNLGTTEVLVDETEFWVDITDPCITANSIVAPTAIPDLIYVRNGHPAATTHNVAFLHDQASDLYGYDQVLLSNGNS